VDLHIEQARAEAARSGPRLASAAVGGFDLTGVFAVEGPGAFLTDLDARLADDARRETCCAPSAASRPSRPCSA
jgi:hypothetical protein